MRADTDASREVDAAVNEGEHIRRIALSAGRMGSWRWNRTTDMIQSDERFRELWGIEADDEALSLADVASRISVRGSAETREIFRREAANEGEFSGTLKVADGPTAGSWLRWHAQVSNIDPSIVFGVTYSITEHVEGEAALRESEARQRALIEGVPQLVWRAAEPGEWTWASPQWTEFTGQPEEASHYWGWLEAIHPDDREPTRAAWESATTREFFEVEHRILARATRSYRWFQTRASPVRDRRDQIVEWLGTSTDVDDLRRLQQRQEVLVKELQHRTFNLMAMVRSTAETTMRSSVDLADFGSKFLDRMEALARTQRLLSRLQDDDRVSFGELIHTEIRSTGALSAGNGRVTLEGPADVWLRSSTVQTFAMALHELTTNAVKYGALHQAGGRLHVRWRVESEEGQPWLHVDWRESGVVMAPEGAPPRGTGQGRALIEEALPYQLHARTTYVMAADGVHCTVALPISHRTKAPAVPS